MYSSALQWADDGYTTIIALNSNRYDVILPCDWDYKTTSVPKLNLFYFINRFVPGILVFPLFVNKYIRG